MMNTMRHPGLLRFTVALVMGLAFLGCGLAGAASFDPDLTRELAAAVEANDLPWASEVLEEGADPNGKDDEDTPFLVVAAEKGFAPLVHLLLGKGAKVSAKGPYGLTALHEAMGQKHLLRLPGDYDAVIAALKKAGAKEDLFTAAMKGDVKGLKTYGGKKGALAQRLDGATPLLLAALGGHTKAVAWLRQQGAAVGLMEAVALGDAALVKSLLQKGENPSRSGPGGLKALHMAAVMDRAALVPLLAQAGADPNAPSARENGKTPPSRVIRPLTLALFDGWEETVKALLEAGADPNQADGSGMMPLMVAVFRGDAALARLLHEKGASVEKGLPAARLSPLQTAALLGNEAVTRLLLKLGAAPDHAEAGAATPMQAVVAAMLQPHQTILWQFQARMPGLFSHRPPRRGQPGFLLEGRYEEVLGLLLKHGADPRRETAEGLSPLKLARRAGDLDLMELLEGMEE